MQFTAFPRGENCLSPGEQLLAASDAESAVIPSCCAGQGVMKFPCHTGDLQIENVVSLLHGAVTAEGGWAGAIVNMLIKQLWAVTCMHFGILSSAGVGLS